jgi:hypothetical protein
MKPEGVWGRGAWWWECEGGSGLGGRELAWSQRKARGVG